MPQSPQKPLVLNHLTIPGQVTTPVTCAEHLGEPDMPRRIPVEFQERTKHQQKVRFGLHMRSRNNSSFVSGFNRGRCDGLRRLVRNFTNLRIDEFHGDILWRQFAVLRHFCKRLGQVDERLSAVGSGEEEYGQGGGIIGGSVVCRGFILWGFVHGMMRREEEQFWLMRGGAVVRRELVGDGLVEGWDAGLENSYRPSW